MVYSNWVIQETRQKVSKRIKKSVACEVLVKPLKKGGGDAETREQTQRIRCSPPYRWSTIETSTAVGEG